MHMLVSRIVIFNTSFEQLTLMIISIHIGFYVCEFMIRDTIYPEIRLHLNGHHAQADP